MPQVRCFQTGGDADGRVPVFLRLHRLRHPASPQAVGLLRFLFVRVNAVSPDAGEVVRLSRRSRQQRWLSHRLSGREQSHDQGKRCHDARSSKRHGAPTGQRIPLVVSTYRGRGGGGSFAVAGSRVGGGLGCFVCLDGGWLSRERVQVSPAALLHLRACFPCRCCRLRHACDRCTLERTDHDEFRNDRNAGSGPSVVLAGIHLAQIPVNAAGLLTRHSRQSTSPVGCGSESCFLTRYERGRWPCATFAYSLSRA